MAKDAREMIAGRFKNERGVIREVGQSLNRPVEIRRRRVDKQKVWERFGRELPAPDERIAQDQGGVVPDKIISQRRRVDREDYENQKENLQEFFQRERFGWTEAIRCASRFGKCLSRIFAACSGVCW